MTKRQYVYHAARCSPPREAAKVAQGRKVANGVKALVVPGSQQVSAAAEAEVRRAEGEGGAGGIAESLVRGGACKGVEKLIYDTV